MSGFEELDRLYEAGPKNTARYGYTENRKMDGTATMMTRGCYE